MAQNVWREGLDDTGSLASPSRDLLDAAFGQVSARPTARKQPTSGLPIFQVDVHEGEGLSRWRSWSLPRLLPVTSTYSSENSNIVTIQDSRTALSATSLR